MLLNFSIENWKSYRDEATLNLVASRERQYSETLSSIKGFRTMKALPIASVYGGNASGKTGFFDALAALRYLVVEGVDVDAAIPVQPFLLDGDGPDNNTIFDITFMQGDTVYRLYVEANKERVEYESLELVRDRAADMLLYERDARKGEFIYEDKYFADSERIAFVARGTRPNQLFLNNAVDQNVGELQEPFSWFSHGLVMLDAKSHANAFASSVTKRNGFLEFASRKLREFDTGISRISGDQVDISRIPLDAKTRKAISSMKEGTTLTLTYEGDPGDYDFDMYEIVVDNGAPKATRLHSYHAGRNAADVPFSLASESSGTKRIMGLLPMLFDMENGATGSQAKVYVVDELDRCLHTMLTAHLIREYLSGCGGSSRKQLLFTTHDLLLMDQSLLRRDEMYIAQRDMYGASALVGLNEFEGLRNDKDLIRSYLDGRFGGIPMLDNMENAYA